MNSTNSNFPSLPLYPIFSQNTPSGIGQEVLRGRSPSGRTRRLLSGERLINNPQPVVIRSSSRLRDCELVTGSFLLSKTLSDSGSGSTVIFKGHARQVVATISFGPLSMSIGTVLSTSLSSSVGFVFAFAFCF